MSVFKYIISIDLGTTFSGSCYTYIGDKKRIVHVVRWPEQSEKDTFEKTPTACLYQVTENSSTLIKWGKAAYEHVLINPNDPNLSFIDQFKLKLRSIFKKKDEQSEEWESSVYVQAAIDYLREIHKHTCEQLIRNNPSATLDQFKYVLTVPATWVDRDTIAMRTIAEKAGIIDEIKDSSDKLVILSEAHAAALFCEREYCLASEESKLYKGQRYIVCDAGGGAVDLATFECTTAEGSFSTTDHCQLALESGGASGSTILDRNLEFYLKEKVFFGCIEDTALKYLVDQFIKEIKHYFGGDDPNRNNYLGNTEEHYLSNATEKLSLAESTSNNIAVTEADTIMVDVVENDYDYNQDYESCEEEGNEEDAMSITDSDIDSELFENSDDDNEFDPSGIDETLSMSDYVYFTLPSTGIDPFFLENLSLKGSVITHKGSNIKQLRIRHQEISKHVFDPVVCRVIDLIEQQIKKSRTTIDTLFLLGGFGQSPYLYKKIHQELITNTNGINHLIVPEDGYRASMRGGIHYGLESTGSVPSARCYKETDVGKFTPLPWSYSPNYKYLVGIDFNFFDTTARFSIIEADLKLDQLVIFNEPGDGQSQLFTFDSNRFLEEYYDKYMGPYFREIFSHVMDASKDNSNSAAPNMHKSHIDAVYYNYILYGFVDQLFQQIQQTLESKFSAVRPTEIRYTVSFASAPTAQEPMIAIPERSAADNIMSSTRMGLLKSALLNKLNKSEEKDPIGLKDAIVKHSTFFAQEDIFLRDMITTGGIYDYVFAAAKRSGMISSDNEKDRFLKNTSCPYATFLDCKNRYFTRNLEKYPVAKTFHTLFSKSLEEVADVQKNCSMYKLGERFSTYVKNTPSDDFLTITKGWKEPPVAYALEIKTGEDNPTGLAGKLTRISSDINNIELLEEKVLYESDPLDFVKLKSPHWCDMYDEVIQTQQLYSPKLYTTSSIKTAEALLMALTIETNFMSKHLRSYLETRVDLHNLPETHSIKDLFIDPLSSQPAEITSFSSDSAIVNTIYQSIQAFSEAVLTTKDILNYLLIPWVRYRLAPTIMNTYLKQQKWRRDTDFSYESWSIIISGDIIKTKSSVSMASSIKFSAFRILLTELKQQLERFFNVIIWRNIPYSIHLDTNSKKITWKRIPYCIYYDADCDKTRFINNLLRGALVQQKQPLHRIAEKRYAVHFMKFSDTTYISPRNSSVSLSQKEGIVYLDSQNNNLALYSLIEKNQLLKPSPLRDAVMINNKSPYQFCVASECHLSAVLYASADEQNQDYFISNNSFKKLHRFIIPIRNHLLPVEISYVIEEYSILFTIKQDQYEADFSCNDYAFCVQ